MNAQLKWEICHQNRFRFRRKEPGSATRSEVTIFMMKQPYLEEPERLLAKSKHWINIEGSDKCLKSLDLEQVEDLRELEENIYLTAVDTNDVDVRQAMLVELENRKHLDFYSEVEDIKQVCVSTR